MQFGLGTPGRRAGNEWWWDRAVALITGGLEMVGICVKVVGTCDVVMGRDCVFASTLTLYINVFKMMMMAECCVKGWAGKDVGGAGRLEAESEERGGGCGGVWIGGCVGYSSRELGYTAGLQSGECGEQTAVIVEKRQRCVGVERGGAAQGAKQKTKSEKEGRNQKPKKQAICLQSRGPGWESRLPLRLRLPLPLDQAPLSRFAAATNARLATASRYFKIR